MFHMNGIQQVFGLFQNLKIEVRKTLILPIVLYGCEMLSLILTKKHRLREDSVGMRIVGGESLTRDIMVYTVYRIYSEGLRSAGHLAELGEGRSTSKILTDKATGLRSQGSVSEKRNIRMDFK